MTDRAVIGHSSNVRLAWAVLMFASLAIASCNEGVCSSDTIDDAGADACLNRRPVVVLVVEGAFVTSITSSCNNAHLITDHEQLDVLAEPLERPATCHIEVRLSDDEHFAFNMPFTQPIDCPTCIGGYTATWQGPFINVVPGAFDGGFASIDASHAD